MMRVLYIHDCLSSSRLSNFQITELLVYARLTAHKLKHIHTSSIIISIIHLHLTKTPFYNLILTGKMFIPVLSLEQALKDKEYPHQYGIFGPVLVQATTQLPRYVDGIITNNYNQNRGLIIQTYGSLQCG